MAKKIQLNYEPPEPRREPRFNGALALALSFVPIVCYCGLRFVQAVTINFEIPEIAARLMGLACILSWFLSLVFASFALREGGRSRTMGFWAIGISLSLLLIPVALNVLLNR